MSYQARKALSFVQSKLCLGLLSSLCLATVHPIEHFVPQNGHVLVDFLKFVHFPCFAFLINNILFALPNLILQQFNPFLQLSDFRLVFFAASKHSLVDLLHFICLLRSLSLESCFTQKFHLILLMI